MSLINEALKKARAEGAQDEARRRGAAYTGLPVHVTERPPRRWLVPAFAGAVVALLVVSAAWLALRSATAEEPIAAAAAPVAVEPPPAAKAPPVAEASAAPPPVAEVPVAEPEPPPAPTSAETAIAPPEPAIVRPLPAAAPPPPPPLPKSKGGSFTRIAKLPGGVQLELQFIVWSDKPFAQINDILIEPGEAIAGYRLIEVEREKVIFEGPDGKIEIKAR